MANVARTWTTVAATLVGYILPKNIPGEWQRFFEALVGEDAPDTISSEREADSALTLDKSLQQSGAILNDLKRKIPLLA